MRRVHSIALDLDRESEHHSGPRGVCASIRVPGLRVSLDHLERANNMSRMAFLVVFASMLCQVRLTAAAPPQQYRFTYRPLVVGDTAHETLRFAIDMKTIRSQDGQVVDMNDQLAVREQSLVVRLAPDVGQSAKVRLTYERSQQTTQPRAGVCSRPSVRWLAKPISGGAMGTIYSSPTSMAWRRRKKNARSSRTRLTVSASQIPWACFLMVAA